jgi:SAM-dependent methyltransferase
MGLVDELRLNIGAGATYIPDFRNIDIDPRAEIQVDLGREQLPFEDSSVSLIFSHHTLEHVDDYLFALGEMHRVLEHDGTLLLGLPYVTLTEYNLVNPYHRRNFSEHSFAFFDPDLLKGSAVERNAILLRRAFLRFEYMPGFGRLPEQARVWCRRHLLNVVRSFDIGLAALKELARPVRTGQEREAEMRRLFDYCLAHRRKY